MAPELVSSGFVPHVTRDAPVDELVALVREHGCCVVDRLASDDVMDRLREELNPYLVATRTGGDEFTGFNTRRTGSLIARSATFRTELAAHPVIVEALDQLLGDHATSYQLHLTQIIDIGPGEPAQPVHRDQWAFDFFSFPAGFEVECHVMWALTEFTEENGATRVIPASNHWPDKLRPGADRTVGATMERGSVLVYIGSLYHGGGANSSSANRLGVNVGYTLSWLRQEENQYLACPPQLSAELGIDDTLLRLMGYRNGAYALGYFGDLQDPIEAVRGSAASGAATFAASVDSGDPVG